MWLAGGRHYCGETAVMLIVIVQHVLEFFPCGIRSRLESCSYSKRG